MNTDFEFNIEKLQINYNFTFFLAFLNVFLGKFFAEFLIIIDFNCKSNKISVLILKNF